MTRTKFASQYCFNSKGQPITPPGLGYMMPMVQGVADAQWMMDSAGGPSRGLEKRACGNIPTYNDDNLAYAIKRFSNSNTSSTKNHWAKKASDYMGNTNDQELEMAIFTLSSHFIKDKAPKLFDMNYFVGFRILDKSDDNTKVVGIYGFKIGKNWVYIPIFFNQGKISGYELAYLQNKDQFVPLKEGWIEYVIKSSGDDVFGTPNEKDLRQLGVRYPDMRQLTQPPILGKVASFEPWVQMGVLSLARQAGKEIPNTDIANLEKIASADARVYHRLAVACHTYPILKVAMDHYYGDMFFQRTYNKLLNAHTKIAKAKRKVEIPIVPRTKTAAVHIITKDDEAAFPFLTEKQAAELIELGNLVIDKRKDDEVAIVENEMQFESPQKTGVYDVFFGDGSIRECLVIINPLFSRRHPSRELSLVVDWKRKSGTWGRTAAILCVRDTYKSDWFNRLPADQFKSSTSMRSSEAKECTNRVIICPEGRGTAPFNAYNKDGAWQLNHGYHSYTTLRDRTYDVNEAVVNKTISRKQDLIQSKEDFCLDRITASEDDLPRWLICSSTFAGKRMVIRDDKLILPDKFKYIDLDNTSWENEDKRNKSLPLATENDVIALIHSGRKKLKVAKVQDKYILDRVSFTKEAAFKELVTGYSFRDTLARELLKVADLAGHQLLEIPYREPLYKTAELPIDPVFGGGGYLHEMHDNVMSPVFQDQPISSDGHSGLPIQGDISEAQRLGYEDQPVPPDFLYEVPPPDPMAMQEAADAAQTGRKDIFDVSMLAGLLNTNRTGELLADYTKVFKVALDRIGRTLFKLYWDRDPFIDQFGEDDIEKLEETLKDVLDTLGDLTLFLLQKDDRPELGDILDSISLDG